MISWRRRSVQKRADKLRGFFWRGLPPTSGIAMSGWLRREHADHLDFRLYRRRRRLGRLRSGQPADRLGPPSRAAVGGRRTRPQHLDSHSARLRQAVQRCQGQLALFDRTGTRLDNRKLIQPRGKVLGGSSSINGLLYIRGQRAGFRPLAPARQCRLELRGRAALLPARRGPGARRGCAARDAAGRSPSPM